MADKTTAYKVGRGKPPAHSQFKKGQSGNPGGKPGPVKSMQARLKLALDETLCADPYDLKHATSLTALDEVVKCLVRSAAGGTPAQTRLLLSLMEKLDMPHHAEPSPSEDPQEPGANDPEDDKTGTSTLSQGRSQGRIENVTAPNAETVAEQPVERSVEPPSGKTEEAAETPEVPARPKRATIMVAGRIVQQGD